MINLSPLAADNAATGLKADERMEGDRFAYDRNGGGAPHAPGQLTLPVPADIAERMLKVGGSSDAALLILAASGVMAVLARHTGNRSVAVGVPAFGKEAVAGLLDLRCELEPEDSLKDWLQRVKKGVASALERRAGAVAAATAADASSGMPAADAASNPPMTSEAPSALISGADAAGTAGLPPVRVAWLPLHGEESAAGADADAVFAFRRDGGAIALDLLYNAAGYSEARAAQIAGHWLALMGEALRQPAEPLAAIPIVAGDEAERIVRGFNETAREFPREQRVQDWLEVGAALHPERTAVLADGERLTYGELNARANRLARLLVARGVAPDMAVPIAAERSASMLVGVLAIVKAGGAYLPIDPKLPAERIRFMLRDSGARLALIGAGAESLAAELADDIDCLPVGTAESDRTGAAGAIDAAATTATAAVTGGVDAADAFDAIDPSADFPCPAHAGNLAYIIYTSGSTGTPKGVMVEHRSVINRLLWMQDRYPLGPEDVILHKTPFTFDVSVWELFWWSAAGASVALLQPGGEKDPREIAEAVQRFGATVMHFVPSMLALFLEQLEREEPHGAGALRSLKRVFTSGEALQASHVLRFERLLRRTVGADLVNLYGPTEATVDVTYHDCFAGDLGAVVPIGRPIDNTRLYIVNERMQLQPVGAPGELCIAGVGLARGYLGRDELTAERFAPHPFEPGERLYRTGDLACWLPDGSIEYKGRLDHQVKIRGNRIELGEIEHALLAQPGVREAVVVAGADAAGEAWLCGYCVAGDGWDADVVRSGLERSLPGYMVPAYLVRLERMPLTPSGKTDRKALPSPERHARETAAAFIAPATELERAVERLWARELGVERAGMDDHFFQQGGDSIKVIRLASAAGDAFGVRLKSRDFYREPTLRGLCMLVEEQLRLGGTANAEPPGAKGMAAIEGLKADILADPQQAAALPGDWEELYPLSSIQQSMVFYSRLRPEEPVYHDQFCYQFDIRGFDAGRFGQTLRLLCEAHPILRTTFHLTAFREPVQIVHRAFDPEFAFADLTKLDKAEQEAEIRRGMEADLGNRYRFDNERLWRAFVYRVGEAGYCLVLSFHHAILDGWSVASFIHEFAELYDRLAAGETVETQPLRTTYKDYVALQLSREPGEDAAFWQERMAGYTRSKLPFNFAGTRIAEGGRAVILRETLDADVLAKLERKAEELSCTFMELCFAAHLVMLSMLTTEREVVTGLVTHDRPDLPDGERMLGCFLNTVPFRMAVDKRFGKKELLSRIGEALRAAKPHEIFLADIAAAAGERNQKENPFFDTLFNYIDMHVLERVDMTGAGAVGPASRPLDIGSNEMTNTLFDMEISRTLRRLELQLKYAPAYFDDSEMRTAVRTYIRILERLADGRDTVDCRDCLLEDQVEHNLYDFNRTAAEFPQAATLHGLFAEQARLRPDAEALVFEGRHMTYGELDAASNRVAGLLIRTGVEPNDHVGLLAQRGTDMIVFMLAILKSGAAYVPIDPDFPEARIAHIVDNAGIRTLLADQAYALALPVAPLVPDEAALAAMPDTAPDIVKDASELAYIIYTSGSTGTPKGVMIEHRSAVNLVLWVNREYGVSADDSLLFLTSMCFDLSVYDVFGTLAAGGRIVIASKSHIHSPSQLKRLIADEAVTFWDSVPTTMNHLIQLLEETDPDYRQTALRLVFMSGDWIPVSLPERVRRHFPNASVISLGGATEAAVWSNYYPVEGPAHPLQSSIPYGRPLANNYFYILDDELNPVPTGVAGELFIGGVGVARGYRGDEERTARAFLDNPFLPGEGERMYRTGDLGRMLPEGAMEFLGRKDHQVKIRGYRVELGEIEAQLCKLEAVKEACVIDRADTNGTNFLCAYLVANGELSASAVKEALGETLPGYMIPGVVMQIPKLPLTPNGKIDRNALPEPVIEPEKERTVAPPRNETDKRLHEIWSAALGGGEFGIDDNFFEIGGHSLLAVKLEIEIEKFAGVPMDMFVYQYQTIREQSDFLLAAKEGS